MNTISKGMQDEAQKIFSDSVVGKPEIKAVVFTSSKPDNFIAGADIDMVCLLFTYSPCLIVCLFVCVVHLHFDVCS